MIGTTESRISNFDGVSTRIGKLVGKSQVVEQPDIIVPLDDHLPPGVTDRDQRVESLAQAAADDLEGHLLADLGVERKQVDVFHENRPGDRHRQLDHLGSLHRRDPLRHRHLLLGHRRNLINQENMSIRQATLGGQPQAVEAQGHSGRDLDVENRPPGCALTDPGRLHASLGHRDPQGGGQFQPTAVKDHASFLAASHRGRFHPLDKRLAETG